MLKFFQITSIFAFLLLFSNTNSQTCNSTKSFRAIIKELSTYLKSKISVAFITSENLTIITSHNYIINYHSNLTQNWYWTSYTYFFYDLIENKNGDLVILGYAFHYNLPGILKFNKNGNNLWNRLIRITNESAYSRYYDVPSTNSRIFEVSGLNYIIFYEFYNSQKIYSTTYLKLNDSGSLLEFTFIGTPANENIYGAKKLKKSDQIIVYFSYNNSKPGFFAFNTTNLSTIPFSRKLFSESFIEQLSNPIVLNDGGFILLFADTNKTGNIIKFNSNYNIVWAKKLQNIYLGAQGIELSDGNIVLSYKLNNYLGLGNNQIFLKLNENGTLLNSSYYNIDGNETLLDNGGFYEVSDGIVYFVNSEVYSNTVYLYTINHKQIKISKDLIGYNGSDIKRNITFLDVQKTTNVWPARYLVGTNEIYLMSLSIYYSLYNNQYSLRVQSITEMSNPSDLLIKNMSNIIYPGKIVGIFETNSTNNANTNNHTYSFSTCLEDGADNMYFEIDNINKTLIVKSNSSLGIKNVRIRTTNQAGLYYEKTFLIKIQKKPKIPIKIEKNLLKIVIILSFTIPFGSIILISIGLISKYLFNFLSSKNYYQKKANEVQ